jgi:nucleoside 2-deoxyribosyltransferase
MTDWFEDLTPGERRRWDEFASRTRKTFRMMDQSAMVMTLVPSGEPDVKFCVELGMAIMLGKPIVAVAASLADVPARLRRAADEVIICDDPDTPEGREYMTERLRAFKDRHLR